MNRFLWLLLPVVIGVVHCSNPQQAGGSDETSTGIKLAGFVYNQSDNSGVANVVTRLKKTGFATTTDEDGFFELVISEDSLEKEGVVLKGLEDTLQYSLGDTVLAELLIDEWEAVLPSVFIVQRNIYGKISGDTAVVNLIKAVITVDSTGDSVTARTFTLWYNRATSGYSGFSWFFNADETVTHYSVYVTVFNEDSILTGRSRTIQFPDDIAGDIEIPTFDAQNALPVADAGNPCTVSVNDTVVLKGSAHDTFGGSIVKWGWDIGAVERFIETTSDSILVFIAPAGEDRALVMVLQVTDDDGNTVTDSVEVTVLQDVPSVTAAASDYELSINDTVMVHAAAQDGFGQIEKWEWMVGDDTVFTETTPDSFMTFVAPSVPDSTYRCIVRVTDDDDNNAMDSIYLNVTLDIPMVSLSAPQLQAKVNDTITIAGGASDRFGSIVKWVWSCDSGGSLIGSSSDSIARFLTPSSPADSFTCVLTVTDDDGNSAAGTLSLFIYADPPLITAYASPSVCFINDTIHVSGKLEKPDSLVRIEWSWDGGPFTEAVSLSDYAVKAPPAADAECAGILRVTDVDGNSAADTVYVKVLQGVPEPSITGNTFAVLINKSINTYGHASDTNGVIVKWEWDIGNTGTFVETTPDSNYVIPPQTAISDSLPVVLRVTDDDGNSALDTAYFLISYFQGGSRSSVGPQKDNAVSVITADIDKSDFIDLIAVFGENNNYSVEWLNRSTENPWRAHQLGMGECVKDMVTADLDSDGDVDILWSSCMYKEFTWYENLGTDNFTEHTLETDLRHVGRIAVYDLDGDDDNDIILSDGLYSVVNIFSNDGDQNFTETRLIDTVPQPVRIGAVFIDDVDGDSDPDIICPYDRWYPGMTGAVIWYENDGDLSFTPHVLSGFPENVMITKESCSFRDMDLDGDRDIIFIGTGNDIYIYENAGEGEFNLLPVVTLPEEPWRMITADIDSDGDEDIITATGNSIDWHENRGSLQFETHKLITDHYPIHEIRAVDLDGDTDTDLLYLHPDGSEMYIMYNWLAD